MQTDAAEEVKELRMSRQSLLLSKRIEGTNVIIIGVGSIGSNAAHICASMGIHNITLVDHDTVKDENIFPSWFYPTHIGKPKVEAVRLQLAEYGIIANAHVTTIEDFVPENNYHVCIVATDTLESRAQALEKMEEKCIWWLDGRMGGEGCELFAINMRDYDAKRIYKNVELEPIDSSLLCGEKATAYNTKGTLVQFIGWALRDIAKGEKRLPYQRVGLGGRGELLCSHLPPDMPKENE